MDDNILLVIGVALVVSIIASYATTTMTSNVIKVSPATTAQNVYTTSEIDSKLSGVFLGNNLFSFYNPSSTTTSGTNIVWFGDVKITLLNVGEGGSVLVDVNGFRDTIYVGSTKIINFLSITNVGTNYNTDVSKRSAVLKIEGSTTITTSSTSTSTSSVLGTTTTTMPLAQTTTTVPI